MAYRTHRIFGHAVVALAFTGLVIISTPALSEPVTLIPAHAVSASEITQALTSLGYTPTSDSGYVWFRGPDNFKYYFAPNGTTRINGYVVLPGIPSNKSNKTTFVDALKFNDTNATFFSITQGDAGFTNLNINLYSATIGPTDVVLRSMIFDLQAAAERTRTIWDYNSWK